MLGATCYIANANDGAACNKLGRVCKYKLGNPATFSSLAKKRLHGDNLASNLIEPATNFVEGLHLLFRKGFTSHPVLSRHVTALADGAHVFRK